MLRWMDGKEKHRLSIEFTAQTFQSIAIVMFVELISQRNPRTGFDFGRLEV